MMDRSHKLSRNWLDDRYLQKHYKTKECRSVNCKRDFSCPYYHSWIDRRREAEVYKTKGCRHAWMEGEWINPKKLCKDGDACEFAHSRLEMQYHSNKYKTQLCREHLKGKDTCLRSIFCAFKHGVNDHFIPARESNPRPVGKVINPTGSAKAVAAHAPCLKFGSHSYAAIASFGLTSPHSAPYPPSGNSGNKGNLSRSTPSENDTKCFTRKNVSSGRNSTGTGMAPENLAAFQKNCGPPVHKSFKSVLGTQTSNPVAGNTSDKMPEGQKPIQDGPKMMSQVHSPSTSGQAPPFGGGNIGSFPAETGFPMMNLPIRLDRKYSMLPHWMGLDGIRLEECKSYEQPSPNEWSQQLKPFRKGDGWSFERDVDPYQYYYGEAWSYSNLHANPYQRPPGVGSHGNYGQPFPASGWPNLHYPFTC